MTSERIAALARKLADDYVQRYHTPREIPTSDSAAPLELPEVGESMPPIQKLEGSTESKED